MAVGWRGAMRFAMVMMADDFDGVMTMMVVMMMTVVVVIKVVAVVAVMTLTICNGGRNGDHAEEVVMWVTQCFARAKKMSSSLMAFFSIIRSVDSSRVFLIVVFGRCGHQAMLARFPKVIQVIPAPNVMSMARHCLILRVEGLAFRVA